MSASQSPSRLEFQAILEAIEGVNEVWFQPDGTNKLNYPVILYERGGTHTSYADDEIFLHRKMYTVTVIDRNPDSEISDRVQALRYSTFDRFYRAAGLNHFVFNVYF